MLDETLTLALETIMCKKQALIFVPSRASAEKTAEDISKHTKIYLMEQSEQVLKGVSSPTKQCRRLANCVKKGIAFHHAGLCLPPETEIILANGKTKSIKEIVTQFIKGKTFEIMTLDPIDLKIKKKKLSDVFVMSVKEPLIQIKTRLGKKVTLTQKHPLLTIDKESKLVWKEAKDIQINEYVATARIINIKKTKVPRMLDLIDEDKIYVYDIKEKIKQHVKKVDFKTLLSDFEIKKIFKNTNITLKLLKDINKKINCPFNLYCIVKNVHWYGSHNKTFIPDLVSLSFLRFVGIIAADGSIHKNGSMSLESTDSEIINECEKIIVDEFRISSKKSIIKNENYKQKYKLIINSRIASNVLINHFGLNSGKKSNKIFASQLIKNLPNEHIASYLSGLFDCDGGFCTSKNRFNFEYTTASRVMAEDVQQLLQRFGIYSYISKRDTEGRESIIGGKKVVTRHDLYRVFIYGYENLNKMMKFNLVKLCRKKNKLKENLMKVNGKNQVDVIPNLGTLFNQIKIKNKCSLNQLSKHFPLTTLFRLEKNKNPIKRKMLQKISNFFNNSQLNKIAFSDLLWDRVEKKKLVEGINKVYDLEVKETNNFIIKNGIICHNTSKQKTLIEDEFRAGNIRVICCTPTLCLSGDTSIWQPTGTTSVKNLGNSDLFALSQNNKLSVMKAKKVNKNWNSQKLIKITSSSGYSIKLTPDHKILIKRGTKKQLILSSECKKKDKIATVGKLDLDKTTKPKISNFVVDNPLPIPDRELTEDDFYFIGSMLGDGHSGAETRNKKIKYKGSPSFTSGDLESIELIKLISKQFDNFSKRVKRRGSISLVLSKKKWFREFLCRSGIEIGKDKYINNLLMQADLKLVGCLLRGVFDTDGCVETSKKVSFSNISFKLIRNIQRLLLRFGIVSYLRNRPAGLMRITEKEYQTKESFELIISQNRCLYRFNELVGFGLKRKQEALEKVITKISHILYSECPKCDYKIYSDVFSGRSQQHKTWGDKKRKVIELLGKDGELGSRVIQKKLGFLPRHKTGNRLNHHYELINKRRIGSRSNTEWFWKLDLIGSWIYWRIFNRKKEISEFFKLTECPICKNKLNKKLRKKWRDSDFDGDIFWDYVKSVEEVEVEEDVYDVVLPDKPNNDHMFVANGFIVHNSAGMSLPAFRVIIKSLKRYSGRWGMNWIPVLEYHQMAGRAGRPEYESYGEAITIAKTDAEKLEIYEKYVCGSPEEIYSKLAVEPVFRTYLLSLIATGITSTKKKLIEFFSKTFWAYQFQDMNKIRMMVDDMLKLLEEYEFIQIQDIGGIKLNDLVGSKSEVGRLGFVSANSLVKNKSNDNSEENIFIKPTLIGRRVSELYLDPLTANHLIQCLKNCYNDKVEVTHFSFLQMISNTLEMVPPLRIKVREHEEIQEKLVEKYDQLLESEPIPYSPNYEDFINSIKTSLFFEAWIDEQGEDFLMEKYGVRPGEIFVKLAIADWLLYSSSELARLLQFQPLLKELSRLRIRVKNGVKEELLPLLKLKGVGRKRARNLFKNGIKDLGEVKKAELSDLVKILGVTLAVDVKKQLGEEVKEVPKGRRKGQLSLMKY